MRPMMKRLLLSLIMLLLVCFVPSTGSAKKKKHVPSDLAMSHNNQGVQYLATNDIEKAEWEFKTAAEMDPKYPEAWNNLGLVYKYKGEYPQAIEALKQAIKADAKWASPYNHLGAVQLSRGNIIEAIEKITKATKLDKKYADAFYNLGLCYREYVRRGQDIEGNRKKAIAAFKKATGIDPRLYHAHSDLGDVYREIGQWEKAIIRYRLAIETKPDDPEPWNKLGSLYLEKGDTERSQAAFAKAHTLSSGGGSIPAVSQKSHQESRIKYGESLLNQGELNKALELFLKICQESPRDEKAFFDLGYTYFLLKRYTDAKEAYAKAREINPDFVEANFNLGMTYLALEDRPSAIKEFKNALVINPHHARSLFNLGMLFNESKNNREASRYLCVFIKDKPAEFQKEVEIAKKVTQAGGGCSGF
ncbi:MAG: tetratricopeptide repeat protein [Deltaproteobacteria bacterium]|nr:tetratricopeptide repeat protein [Deltaproteobacteria bacterium]